MGRVKESECQTVDEFLNETERSVEEIREMVERVKTIIKTRGLTRTVYKKFADLTDEELEIRRTIIRQISEPYGLRPALWVGTQIAPHDVAVTFRNGCVRRVIVDTVQIYPLIDEDECFSSWVEDAKNERWDLNVERGMKPVIHCPKCDAIVDKQIEGNSIACDACGHEFETPEKWYEA